LPPAMAAVLGLPLQPDDEVLADLPEHEKAADPLRFAKVLKTCSVPGGGFREFAGEVVEVEVGSITGDRLYRVRYSDGDLQHFTADEVRACIPPAPQERTALADVSVPQRPQQVAAPQDAAPVSAPAAVEEAAAEVAEPAGMEEEVALSIEAYQEEAILAAATELEEEAQEEALAEGQDAGEAEVEAVGEQEAVEAVDVPVGSGEEDMAAEEAAALEELTAGVEESLLVLEEPEEELAEQAEAQYLEEMAAAPLEKQDEAEAPVEVDAAEADLLDAYLGGDDDEFAEVAQPEVPAAPVERSRGLGVQRDIAKVNGRAKMKAQAKVKGRPAVLEEVEMEAFNDDEEAT